MSEKKESNAFFWGFVLGAAAGAVWTLLKTPRSGKETIGEIRSRGQEMRTLAGDLVGKGSSQVSDYATSAQSQASKMQSQASDLADQAMTQAQDAGEVVAEQVEETVDAASGLVEETIDVVEEGTSSGKRCSLAQAEPSAKRNKKGGNRTSSDPSCRPFVGSSCAAQQP